LKRLGFAGRLLARALSFSIWGRKVVTLVKLVEDPGADWRPSVLGHRRPQGGIGLLRRGIELCHTLDLHVAALALPLVVQLEEDGADQADDHPVGRRADARDQRRVAAARRYMSLESLARVTDNLNVRLPAVAA
jgi:hypothetical protein